MFKKKYIAVFLIKEQESYTILSSKIINPIKTEITYDKGLIPINITIPSFTKGLKLYYFLDTGNGIQLSFDNNKNINIDTKVIDNILRRKIISELTSNMEGSNFKQTLMNFIIGAIVGGLIGYIVGGFV